MNKAVRIQQQNYSQKGVSLYITILVMALLLSIAFGLGIILLGEIQSLRGVGHSVVALYAAEAGFERVLYEDFQGTSALGCDGMGGAPSFCSTTLSNNASYDIFVIPAGVGSCSGIFYCVEATGSFDKATRKLEIQR